MRGQRQLDEDAVDRRIGIEPVDQLEQFRLAGVGGQPVLEAQHPGLERRLALVADIDGAGRILADQHHGKARSAARGVAEPATSPRHIAPEVPPRRPFRQ